EAGQLLGGERGAVLVELDRVVESEDAGGFAGRHAGRAEPVSVLAADRGVGEAVCGLAQHVDGEGAGGVDLDRLVVGQVHAALSREAGGDQAQGGCFAGAGAGLDNQVGAARGGIDDGGLLGCGRVGHAVAPAGSCWARNDSSRVTTCSTSSGVSWSVLASSRPTTSPANASCWSCSPNSAWASSASIRRRRGSSATVVAVRAARPRSAISSPSVVALPAASTTGAPRMPALRARSYNASSSSRLVPGTRAASRSWTAFGPPSTPSSSQARMVRPNSSSGWRITAPDSDAHLDFETTRLFSWSRSPTMSNSYSIPSRCTAFMPILRGTFFPRSFSSITHSVLVRIVTMRCPG